MASMDTFSVKESVAYGWKAFWARPWLFVLAGIAATALNLLFSIPQSAIDGAAETIRDAGGTAPLELAIFSLIFGIIGFVVSLYVNIGTTRFVLKAHDDLAGTRVKDLVYLRRFWAYLGASLLVALAVLAGLILLIVPGIIVGLALSFALYVVIDKDLGPVEAFKESMRLTKGNRLKLLYLALALCGLNILGALALLVGLAVTIPVSMLASVHAYRVLSREGSEAPATEAEPVASSSPEVVAA